MEQNYEFSIEDEQSCPPSGTISKSSSWRQSESSEDGAEWKALRPLYDDVSSLGSKRGRNLDSLSERSDQVVPSHIHESRSSEDSLRSKELIGKWKEAARKCTPNMMTDPWQKFNINDLPVQNCVRHRYSSIRKRWSQDRVQVKMHPEAFARGAMRECYRLKKLSTFDTHDSWDHAQNYVAKKYIQNVDRQVLFEDVKLQMDSKLWAEEFNRHNPPKKIDIVQMCVLEFVEEPGSPLYHLEHYIEGDYVKYNSNSGFVSDVARRTPQAFSHFTFERSGHQMIVVDIQGVGDLYTDPQIHTVTGTEYGDGNLGTKGMALFFHSHLCNEICHSMCLTEFDLSASELQALKEGNNREKKMSLATQFVNADLLDVCSPLVIDDEDSAMERLRMRTISMTSSCRRSSTSSFGGSACDDISAHGHGQHCSCDECLEIDGLEGLDTHSFRSRSDVSESVSMNADATDDELPRRRIRSRTRLDSTSSCCSSRMTRETEREAFWLEARKLSRPAGFLSETEMRQLAELARQNHTSSILGQIHLDLARYHELGRFIRDDSSASSDKENHMTVDEGGDGFSAPPLAYDKEAALYHLDIARRCGVLEAIITVAEMAYGLPHELLKDVGNDEYWGCDDPEELGLELMESAAEMGDRPAMLFVAEAYETGRRLGKSGSPSWTKAVSWYSRAANFSEDSEDEMDGTLVQPRYVILQKLAEMYKEGGYGLEQDLTRAYEYFTEAAEAAMEAMRGKLANKLYELAEQCAG